MLCLVMRYRGKIIVIMVPVVFLLIENLSVCVYEPVEFQTGLSDFVDKDRLNYSVPETTTLIVIGVRDECLACYGEHGKPDKTWS
jgi:hypothetical protein